MNIKVTADSTCDLSADILEEYNIAVSVGGDQEHFAKYADEYDGGVHICISSDFSSTYRHAGIAAEDFENVRVVDSRNLSTGQGLVVLKACELAKTATSLDALKQELARDGRLQRLQAIADSTDGQRFADALDAQKIEQAARTGDTELLRQILTQVLSTDTGQRLAGKVQDAVQDG